MTVVRGTGLEPPRKKFGPPPMMSRESNSSAKAPPAVADSSAMAASGAAKNRIIVSPSKKIDSTEVTGHICGLFASHGPVRPAILNDWRYQIGNHADWPESVSQTRASPRGAGPRCPLLL